MAMPTISVIDANPQEEALGNASYIRDSAEQVSRWIINKTNAMPGAKSAAAPAVASAVRVRCQSSG
jgi:hypothetical protein